MIDAPTVAQQSAFERDARVVSDGFEIHLSAYAFLDWRGLEETHPGGENDRSYFNRSEAAVVAATVRAALRHARADATVAVVTPYASQKAEIWRLLSRGEDSVLGSGDARVRCNTVDSYQGQEADIVVFSCVGARAGVSQRRAPSERGADARARVAAHRGLRRAASRGARVARVAVARRRRGGAREAARGDRRGARAGGRQVGRARRSAGTGAADPGGRPERAAASRRGVESGDAGPESASVRGDAWRQAARAERGLGGFAETAVFRVAPSRRRRRGRPAARRRKDRAFRPNVQVPADGETAARAEGALGA